MLLQILTQREVHSRLYHEYKGIMLQLLAVSAPLDSEVSNPTNPGSTVRIGCFCQPDGCTTHPTPFSLRLSNASMLCSASVGVDDQIDN